MKKIKHIKDHLGSCERDEGNDYCQCKLTAYHEAGHAFMAWWNGITVSSIDTRNDTTKTEIKILGAVWTELSPDETLQAQVNLGGPIAEMIFSGSFSWLQHDTEVIQVTQQLGFHSARNLFMKVYNVLFNNWKSIDYLAEKILNGKSVITQSQFLKLMKSIERY